jgi:hypothetical protein
MAKQPNDKQPNDKPQYFHYKTRRGEEIKISVQVIGPEQAKALLERGQKYNRNLSENHAQKLASKMEAGSWMFNGVPLILNDEMILDGQHRSQGVILSGTEQEFLIVEGVNPKAFRTFDIGKKRDFATMLGIDGEDYPTELAQSVRWMFLHTVGATSGSC